MMTRVSDIPALARYGPRMIKADPDSGVIVLSIPNIRWRTLLVQMEAEHFDLEQMLKLKERLRDCIELLYGAGVAYRVKHDFIFPCRKPSGRWVLYLKAWMDAELCYDRSHLKSPEWKQREAEQYNEIERIFRLLTLRYEDMQDARIHGIKERRIQRWELQDLLRGKASE